MAVAETTGTDPARGQGSIHTQIDQVLVALRDLPVDQAIALAQRCQVRFAAVETEMLARKREAGATNSASEKAAGRGGLRSKRDARQAIERADAVRINPLLGADLDSGLLSPGQLDALAAGSARSGGDAARDDHLVDRVRLTQNPDQARAVVKEWEEKRATQRELDETHARNRRARTVRRFRTKRGTEAIMAEGDRVAVDEMWKCLRGLADQLYRQDGGRDVPSREHPRSNDQRLFDATHSLLTGTIEPAPNEPAPSSSRTRGSRRWRPVLHIAANVEDLFGDGLEPATLLGSGPLPTPELARYSCFADLIGTLYGGDGEVLWQGRRRRRVTDPQWDALVARDRGCVLCGAAADRGEAHHLLPWGAPARGRSDIGELALVCPSCHRHIHATNLTLYRCTTTGTWHTRPAEPDETPPNRVASKHPNGP